MTLFLSPASPVNARKSLQEPVDLADVKAAIHDRQQVTELMAQLGKSEPIYCWALRASKAGVFRKMNKGDEVLFSVTGSGMFDYFGIVTAKLVSKSFAATFWQDSLLLDWPYVFFLRDVRRVDLSKEVVRKLLDYDKNDRFQGIRPVPVERLKGSTSIRALAGI